jgi:hypothetical protein
VRRRAVPTNCLRHMWQPTIGRGSVAPSKLDITKASTDVHNFGDAWI